MNLLFGIHFILNRKSKIVLLKFQDNVILERLRSSSDRCIIKNQCYPSSIPNYSGDIDKGDAVMEQKGVHFEWERLCSFKDVPTVVSGKRLAKSGFYYSGKGEEAICFCCGLRNGSWNKTETVNEIHRKLSPNCNFVKGNETNNVAIHGDSKPKIPSEGVSNECCYSSEEASGGPEDISTVNNRQYGTESTNKMKSENPKYPQYAIKSERLQSYSRWSSSNTGEPEELSTAGFFYAGINDCVRCFFCGGGIKNLEDGGPWIKHARWFPNCAYVKQCKGVDFVGKCQTASTQNATSNRTESSSVSISQQTTTDEDPFIDDLNSNLAVLIDMGYSQIQIEDAIKEAVLEHDKRAMFEENKQRKEYLLCNICQGKAEDIVCYHVVTRFHLDICAEKMRFLSETKARMKNEVKLSGNQTSPRLMNILWQYGHFCSNKKVCIHWKYYDT